MDWTDRMQGRIDSMEDFSLIPCDVVYRCFECDEPIDESEEWYIGDKDFCSRKCCENWMEFNPEE